MIVEDEQNGNERAEYGKAVLEELSKKLTAEFGKGFDESNLRYMRLFYQTFKNCDTLRHELYSDKKLLQVVAVLQMLRAMHLIHFL